VLLELAFSADKLEEETASDEDDSLDELVCSAGNLEDDDDCSELDEELSLEIASLEAELGAVVAVKPPSVADELDSLDEIDEIDEIDDSLEAELDSVVAVKPPSAADSLDEEELSDEDELSDEEDDDAPNTALNWSSVTHVSPTQILFALTAPFSNDIPNIV